MPDLDKYFEYGVGVGMFMVSVILLLLTFRYFTKSNEAIAKNFSDSLDHLDERHRDERDLWQTSEDRRQNQTNEVIMRIDRTIRDCLKNTCGECEQVDKVNDIKDAEKKQ